MVLFHLGHHMGTQIHGHCDGGVAQGFRYYLGINPRELAQGCIRMAQPMKGHMGQVVRPDINADTLLDFGGKFMVGGQ